MMAEWNPEHPHKEKFDGSFDTICLLCFAAIANVAVESDLAAHEKNHACDRGFLAERGMLKRFPTS